MKKILVLLVGVVAILMIAWTTLFRVDSEEKQEFSGVDESAVEDSVATSTEEVALVGSGTLKDLQLLGQDIECVISYSSETGEEVEGTYFVSGGMIRGDFLTDAPDLSGQIVSSLIMDDRMIFVWSEISGEKYGMKMPIPETEAVAEASAPDMLVPMDSPIEYDCKAWPSVDRTIFVPPSDVLFQDYGELMQSGMQEGVLYEEMPVPEM
jgi:hypothetical protein